MRTILISSGDGDLVVTVPGATQNIEQFDRLSPEEKRAFAINVIQRGGVAVARVRTTDRARINDAAAFADDAETCNPVLAGGRTPGAGYKREQQREAERCKRLQAAYDEAGKGERHVRE
jgi:hypothetical protein